MSDWLIGRSGICILPLPGYVKRFEADHKTAGFTSWAVNSLRHFFAGFHLARFRNPKDLALEVGHTRPDTVFRVYH